jgi:outer membrane lipoprotein SlyB
MNDYSSTEIGMLAGAVIGGLMAVLGFLATGRLYFLLAAVIGTAAGTAAGKIVDRRRSSENE